MASLIIIECKCCGAALDSSTCAQLHRYFLTLDSSVGILTDGVRYLFYSNTNDGKKMDSVPFMEFNLENIDPILIPELRKICKGKFDRKTTLDTVNELRFNRQIKRLLAQQMDDPSEGFVDYFIRETYERRKTPKVRNLFFGYVKRAFSEFVTEQIDERLKSALAATSKKEGPTCVQEQEEDDKKKMIKRLATTTEEEWQAYYLVKSLLMGTIDTGRVYLRDNLNFCNILLNNSLRNPIIKLFFNDPEKMSIELIGPNREKISYPISKVEDILAYAEAIRATVKMYDEG
ncbi:hypothetical protein AGMMS49925_08320 [Deltaproteobacteria bacterium]|nr:hypothetical protein AGMMS49925_08320 [Deltaproteobacteria bacterium]